MSDSDTGTKAPRKAASGDPAGEQPAPGENPAAPLENGTAKRRAGGISARMRDVAKRAGVSTMTVSRALSDPERVSAEMRERVIAAVKEIGYLPNHLARSLSSTRSTTIGLIEPSVDNFIYTQTVKGLSEVISSEEPT